MKFSKNCKLSINLNLAVDECGEGTESEQQVLKGLMAFLLLVCLQGTSEPNAK